MRQKILVALLMVGLISICSCYDIQLFGQFKEIEKTIFDTEYPDLYQNYGQYFINNNPKLSATNPTNIPIYTKSNQTPKDTQQNDKDKQNSSQPRSIINSLIKKIYEIRTSVNKILFDQPVKVGDKFLCTQGSKKMFEQQITHFTRLDYSFNNLYPGTLVELIDPTNFAKGMVPVYDKMSVKNPVNIKLTGDNFQYNLTNISSQNQYKRQLFQNLLINLKFLNSRPIKLYILPAAARIETALRKIGLGSSVYEKIFIAGGSEYYTGDKRVVFVLHQKLFSATLDFSNKLSESNKKTLFDQIYESPSQKLKQKFMLIQNKNEKLPQFISQANYGRLLIVSLIDNQQSQNIISVLQGCFEKQILINEQCFNLATKSIRENPTLRYYYAGIDQNIQTQQSSCFFCKRAMKWKKVFFPIDQKTVSSLRPISFNNINFVEQRHKQTDRRYYYDSSCVKDVRFVVYQLSDTTIKATVQEVGWKTTRHPINVTHPGTFQISSLVGNKPFQLNLISQSKRKKSNGMDFFFIKRKPVYSIQYQFAILVNGEQKMRDIIGNSRSDNQYKNVMIYFDPDNGRKKTVR